jgi:hypothetical protein
MGLAESIPPAFSMILWTYRRERHISKGSGMITRIGNVEIWRILESVDAFMEPLAFFPYMGQEAPVSRGEQI